MADRPALLFQGYRGDAAKECKERMKKLGFYKGPIDTHYNAEIAGAAVKLQQQEKLKPVNGGFYQDCWDALDRLEAKQKKQDQQQPEPAAEPKAPEPAKKEQPAPGKGAGPTPPKPGPQKPPPPGGDKKPAPQKPAKPAGPLAPGASGAPVLELQKKLAKVGYPTGADGQYGPGTAFAVKAFQAAHGLPVTGNADQATMDAIEVASKSVSPASGSVKVQPPGTSTFSKPGWNQQIFVHGEKADLFANARGLDGRDVIFMVEINDGDGKWVHFADVPGKVSQGLATAQLELKNDGKTAKLMRFKIQLATQKKR